MTGVGDPRQSAQPSHTGPLHHKLTRRTQTPPRRGTSCPQSSPEKREGIRDFQKQINKKDKPMLNLVFFFMTEHLNRDKNM